MSGIVSITPDVSAVQLVDATRSYGSGKTKIAAIQNCNMTVPRGAIYGLLGPSGCGKTTLLKCIVGRLQLDSGEVVTLGRTPGSVGHSVPGKNVGYMPQDLALYLEFTIGETLNYFGLLHEMKLKDIKSRMVFLLDFLNLPAPGRLVGQLSGGQQRRLSFAVALLQEPDLIILDEPTVGVDPLLRQRIWEHLLTIVQTAQTTIVITTHYIEEARQAHKVGLMRSGRLLAEESPDRLLQLHNMQSLEDVFLKLCNQDQVGDIEDDTARQPKGIVFEEGVTSPDERTPLIQAGHSPGPKPTPPRVAYREETTLTCGQRCWYWLPRFWNLVALSMKNLTIMKRRIGLLIFQFLIPSIQIILFCLCIGRPPSDLPLAIFNNETHPPPLVPNATNYLHRVDNTTITQVPYDSLEAALYSVKTGDCWGVAYVRENFTLNLMKRFEEKGDVDNNTLEGSTITLFLDMSNQQIYITIQQAMVTAFQKYSAATLQFGGHNPGLADLPIKLGEPVYGDLNESFVNFIAPGIILSVTFFMATGLTALGFVLEKKQGLLDRSYTAGVSPIEVMMAHTGTQFLILCGQVALLLTFTLAVFKVPCEGSLFLVIILTLMQGFTGMALGLAISAFCEEENQAIMGALGSVYPNLLLSGIIWPVEGMPHWLRYVAQWLPMTLAAESMRNVLIKGWDLLHPGVYQGFLVTIGWGAFFVLLAVCIVKVKTK